MCIRDRGAAANANIAAQGIPTISGITLQGQSLTAHINNVSDADGINTGTNTYQWLRGGVDISGANSSNYTLVQADVGLAISMRYSYTDNEGNPDSAISASTGLITNVNDPVSGMPVILGTTAKGQTLTADISGVSDADGINTGTNAYQWLRDGLDINNARSNTYTLTSEDVGAVITFKYSYTDNYNFADSVTSSETALITNINTTVSGAPTITGTTTQGLSLIHI